MAQFAPPRLRSGTGVISGTRNVTPGAIHYGSRMSEGLLLLVVEPAPLLEPPDEPPIEEPLVPPIADEGAWML